MAAIIVAASVLVFAAFAGKCSLVEVW